MALTVLKEWEQAFIILTYVDFNNKEIANYLQQKERTIIYFLGRRKLVRKQLYIGQRFGRLIVTKEFANTISKTGKNTYTKWKCICDCGNNTWVSTHDLKNGHTKSCGCAKYPAIKKAGKISAYYYNTIKSTAKQRGYHVLMSMDYLNELFTKQDGKCNLTGLNLKIPDRMKEERTVSLDRIDSNKNYTENNVQFVHKDINLMKNTFDQTYFIKLCRLVAQKFPGSEYDPADLLEKK